jgi:hypothetical protein
MRCSPTRCASIWPRRVRSADGRAPDAAADPGHDPSALADELLFGKLVAGGHVTVDVDENDKVQLSFDKLANPPHKPNEETVEVE